MNFKDFIVSEEDMAPMGDPMGGGMPMGDPMGGGMPMDPMGGAPPMDPMGGMGGGAPPMDPMGGMGGGAPGGVQPPIQFKPNSVWDVLDKILNGEPVNDKEDEEKEKEKEVDQSGQENLDMLSSPQQQEPGMAPTGQVENPQL
jgi:hypothetical protein